MSIQTISGSGARAGMALLRVEAGAEAAIDSLREDMEKTVTVKIGLLPGERHAANSNAAPSTRSPRPGRSTRSP